jgi:hypothetical protein
VLTLACSAGAATINVNTTADLPGPGCPDVSGNCSLRQALTLANGNADPSNTVNLPASIAGYELPNGVLTISKSVTLQGAGAAGTVIVGNGSNRVLIVTGGAGISTAINGVTVTGGFVNGSGGLVGGAGIRDESTAGSLSLAGTVVSGNTATATGGNCCNGGAGIWTDGDVTLVNSSVIGNSMTVTAGAFCCDGGGGLYQDGGAITLTNSSISNNVATIFGGLGNEGGGGFYQDGGNIVLNHSTVSGNRATLSEAPQFDGGGGFYQDGGETSLSEASVSGNTFNQSGSAGTTHNGGGGLFNDSGTLTLTRSTVGANTANVVGTSNNGGGAIFHDSGELAISDSTISANALNVTGTTTNGGGGVYIVEGLTSLTSDTIAANNANVPGGGVFNNGAEAMLLNTIVADDSAPSGTNCAPSPAFASLGHNIDSADTCNLGTAGDKKNTEPLLGVLENNGGPAFTQMPAPGSPAIDAGSNAACAPTDERGEARPRGPACDIGAVESAPPSVTTGPASSIATSAATLSGVASNPDTVAGGSVLFQFGTTVAYGSQTLNQGLAAGASGGAFHAPLAGLTPGKLYHYRAVAATPDGMSFGADSTFITTPSKPPVPTVTRLSESHRIWRAGSKLARATRRTRRPPIGTTFSFVLNQQATVSFRFTQLVNGHRVKGKCIGQTRKNHRKPACRRTVTKGMLFLPGHERTNHVAFQGRISRAEKLKPGSYTLVVTAANSAGETSKPQTVRFTIAKG